MEQKNAHGGAREGAGRPRGTTNRVTAKELLEAAQLITGQPFVVSLMEGYRDSLVMEDNRTRLTYEKMILDKVATTLVEAEVTDSQENINAKQAAFTAAMAALTGINVNKKE